MVYIEINGNDVTYINREYIKLGKTNEELSQTGYFIENIPGKKDIEGKDAILKYNAETKSLYYEYIDKVPIPKTEMELALERIASLEQSNAELTTLIATMTTPTI